MYRTRSTSPFRFEYLVHQGGWVPVPPSLCTVKCQLGMIHNHLHSQNFKYFCIHNNETVHIFNGLTTTFQSKNVNIKNQMVMHDKLLLFQILKHFRYIAILCMIGTNFVQGMLTKVLGCYYTRIIFTDVCMYV